MLTPEQEKADLEVIAQLIRAEREGVEVRRPLMLGPYSCYLLVCGLQLAWRHPDPSPEIRAAWQDMGELIATVLPPDTQKLLARGWDPAQDMMTVAEPKW